MSLSALVQLLNTELASATIKDYCPNGLQVEGKTQIKKVVTGVTACQKLLDAAIAVNADAILVHHGYFWKGEASEITCMKKRRLQSLLRHDISLLAYHLPLDVHATLGNNAQLGKLLGLGNIRALMTVEPRGVVMLGDVAAPVNAAEIAAQLKQLLGREPLLHAAGAAKVKTLAWCSGGGQGYIQAAADAGADLFFSGEVSEQTIHCADELGIHFIAAGHHATERYGIQALGQWLAAQTGIEVCFIDVPNPA
nr:Nif3-like dinuclear metal center hexameric protein [Rheinheimera riviphila]